MSNQIVEMVRVLREEFNDLSDRVYNLENMKMYVLEKDAASPSAKKLLEIFDQIKLPHLTGMNFQTDDLPILFGAIDQLKNDLQPKKEAIKLRVR